MAKLSVKQIQEELLKIINAHPGGVRYSVLVKTVAANNPETPINTIHGSMAQLYKAHPTKFTKAGRGLFQPANNGVSLVPVAVPIAAAGGMKIREQDFYEPFAMWLMNDLDKATEARPLGAAGGGKWSTPDVVGVYRSQRSDFIKFEAEIIAAEIKIDPEQSIVAFGQAVAYRLFSTKSYIVMPDTISEDDKSRLEASCMLHGIGLVLFRLDPKDPDFTIRVRAQRSLPDMFYVNDFAHRLRHRDASLFDQLFG